MHGQHAGDRLDRAGGAEHVPEHRLRGRDRELVRVVAEHLFDGEGLRDVAERRARAVGVHVVHVLRCHARAREGGPHHGDDAARAGVGLEHVVGVVGGAVAEHLRVDPGAPGPCRLELLEDHDAGTFRHHEPLAGGVERAGGPLRVAVPRCQAAHRAEAGQDQRVDAALRAAGDHGVRVAPPDQLGPLADRVRARRAGRHDGVVRPADAELDGELAARRVDEHVGEEGRRHPVRPPLAQHVVLAHELVEAADAVADHDPHPLGVEAVHPRVVHRLLRRREREEDVAVELAHVLRRRGARRVVVLHLARDPHRELARVECPDRVDAAAARHEALPRGPQVVPERRDRPDAGDRDFPHH